MARRGLHWFGGGRWIGLLLLAALLVLRALDPGVVESIRVQTFDFYQRLEPRTVTSNAVVIVDLDEATLEDIGQWPWPRMTVAKLVEKITSYGAAAIALDIVFPEPDRMSPGLYANDLRDLDDAVREQLQRLPSNDEIFAERLRNSPVVLAQTAASSWLGRNLEPIKGAPYAAVGPDPKPFLLSYPDVLRNIPELESAALAVGVISLGAERDGIVRHVPMVLNVQGEVLPSLVFQLLRIVVPDPNDYRIFSDENGIRQIKISERFAAVPTDPQGRLWVRYGPREPQKTFSARDIMSGKVPRAALANKLVLVGTSAAMLFDIRATPLHPFMPGVEVHAQMIETILTESFLKRPAYTKDLELALLAAVGLGMILFVPILGAVYSFLLGAVIAGGLAALAWFSFSGQGLLLDVGYTLFGGFAVYAVLVFVGYLREERRRREVRAAFSHYLSPDLVDQLAKNPDRLVLGGETRDMSILFCDVRGFTTISEKYKDDPQGLTSLMNRFLTPLTKAILDRKGTIDKYMGDAIMAFWNAPLDDPDHPRHACSAALGMLQELEDLNQTRRAEAMAAGEDYLPLNIGIGINGGSCVVGNLGSEQRFDYSVLGDTVNVSSRLEGQSRNYGVKTIIGSTTAAAVAEEFALLELDRIRVKGKTEPETIFALLGDLALAQKPDFQELGHANREMLAAYRAQDWAAARERLIMMRTLDQRLGLGLGRLLDLQERRILAYEADPPDPDWDGVFIATTK